MGNGMFDPSGLYAQTDPNSFLAALQELRQRVVVLEQRPLQLESLDQITSSLGLLTGYSEMRWGNGLEPGDGFSGIRIGWPGFVYVGAGFATSTDEWNIVGVKIDAMSFGLRVSDGAGLFANGGIILDDNGISIDAYDPDYLNLIGWRDPADLWKAANIGAYVMGVAPDRVGNMYIESHGEGANAGSTLSMIAWGTTHCIYIALSASEVGLNSGIVKANSAPGIESMFTIEPWLSLKVGTYPGGAINPGYGGLYAKAADKKLYWKTDAGTEYDLTAIGAPGAVPIASTTVAFTDGDTMKRATVTDANITISSKIMITVRRPDVDDDSTDDGWLYLINVVKVANGSFDILVTAERWDGDADITPPNETITIYYINT